MTMSPQPDAQAPDTDPDEFDVAAPGIVSPQVTDSVTQANVTTLGSGPAVSTVQAVMTLAQAQGVLFANMVNNQHQLCVTSQASLAESVSQILGVDSLD